MNKIVFKSLIYLFMLQCAPSLYGQEKSLFTNVTDSLGISYLNQLPRWFDYNQDGSVDIFNGGNAESNFLMNKEGYFNESEIWISTSTFNDYFFIDINQDEYIDILAENVIYRNLIFDFERTLNNTYEGVPLAVFDVNNDGYQDILTNLLNPDESYGGIAVYINRGNGEFNLRQTINQTGNSNVKIAQIDYNQDGKIDFFVNNKLFTNTNDFYYNTHTIEVGNNINAFENIKVADFNYDGQEDIMFVWNVFNFESYNYDGFIKILVDNNDLFEDYLSFDNDMETRLSGIADLTNDGRLEIILQENEGEGYPFSIYSISDTLTFISYLRDNSNYYSERGFSDFYDYDEDGDLDILLNRGLYRNDYNKKNSPPSVPQNLNASISDNRVLLTWERSVDEITPSPSISYNVSLKHGLDIIINPFSNLKNKSTVNNMKNAGVNTFLSINDLQVGSYIWQVQAIDQGLNTSAFSQSDTFEITAGEIELVQYENVDKFDIVYNPKQHEYVVMISDSLSVYGQTLSGGFFQKTTAYKKLLNLDSITSIKSLANPLTNQYHLIYQRKNRFGFKVFDQALNSLNIDTSLFEPLNNISYLLGSFYKRDYLFIAYLSMAEPKEDIAVDINLKIVKVSLNLNNPLPEYKSIKVGEYAINTGTEITKIEFQGELEDLNEKQIGIAWSLNTEIKYNPTEPLSAGLQVLTLDTDILSVSDEISISPKDSLTEFKSPQLAYNTYNQEMYVSWIQTQTNRSAPISDPYDFSEVYGKQIKLDPDLSKISSVSQNAQLTQTNLQGSTNEGVVNFNLFHSKVKNEYYVLWENNTLSGSSTTLGNLNTLNIDPYNLLQKSPYDSTFANVPASKPFIKYNPDDKSYLFLWYHDLNKKGVTIGKYNTPKDARIKLSSIEPAVAYSGEKVTIHGQNFAKTPYLNQVFFAGIAAQVDTLLFDKSKLQVTVPPGLTSQDVPIFVSFDGLGESSISPQDTFLFGPLIPPAIGNLSFSSQSLATCDEVTLKGEFFSRNSDSLKIKLNDTILNEENIIASSESIIVFKIPLGVQGSNFLSVQTDEKTVVYEDPITIHLGAEIKNSPSNLSDKYIRHISGFNVQAKLAVSIYNNCSVEEISLNYRGISSEEPFTIITDSLKLRNEATNFYSAQLDDNDFNDPLGVEFFFKLKDLSGEIIYSDTSKIYRKFLGKDSTNNLSNFVSFVGSSALDYKLVSAPFVFENNAVSEVFGDLTRKHGADTLRWRLYRYENGFDEITAGEYEIKPGESYAILSREENDNYFVDGTTVNLDTGNFKIILKPGWNLIGNPYPADLSWSNILNFNGDPIEIGDALELQGGWKQVSNNYIWKKFTGLAIENSASTNIILEIPFKNTVSSGRMGNDRKSLWEANLSITGGGFLSNNISFGMHADAKTGWDWFDQKQAPRFINYLEFNSENPNLDGRFSKDFVNEQLQYVWGYKFEQNISSEFYQLTWDLDQIHEGLWLFDRSNNELVDMKDKKSYNFANSESFKLIYGDISFLKEQIKPLHTSIGKLYPNPAYTQLNIPLYISAEDEQIVKVSIWDLSGKQKKIIQKQYTPGLSILELDIADLPKGFYILTAEIDQMQFSQKLIKE